MFIAGAQKALAKIPEVGTILDQRQILAGFSAEDRFLLACVGSWGREAIQRGLEGSIDWDSLCNKSLTLGVAPLVYERLRWLPVDEVVPPEALARLQEAYYGNAARNVMVEIQVSEILRSFATAGIKVIALKGTALAYTLYHNLALRPLGDVDLLVRRKDVSQAIAILKDLGFCLAQEPERRFHPFAARFTGELFFRKEIAGLNLLLELHWEIIMFEWYRRTTALEVGTLWERAQPLDLGGARGLQFSPEDTLLHLCLHLATHCFSHFRGYVDINWLSASSDDFPWEAFLERAAACKVKTAVYFALHFAQKLLGTPIPLTVLDKLRPSRVRQRLIGWLVNPKWIVTGGPPFSRPKSYILHLALIDQGRGLLKMLVWLLFPGPNWLATRYSLTGRVEPYLYCLFHPLFVAWQGLLGIWKVLLGG